MNAGAQPAFSLRLSGTAAQEMEMVPPTLRYVFPPQSMPHRDAQRCLIGDSEFHEVDSQD